ncbi:MAG: CHASE3 domain-containing protein [Aquabacterium sp.]|nr:CHASE3 domain-containing protein [Aquabacterium sp.]
MQPIKVIRRSPVVFSLALLAAVAMLFISEGSYWQSVRTLDTLDRVATVRNSLRQLELGVVDAETNQRGYLLSNRSEYIAPYRRALVSVEAAMAVLDQHYSDTSRVGQSLAQLKRLTATCLSIMAESLRLHDDGKAPAAQELLLSGLGKESMDGIRQVSAALMAQESASLAAGRARLYDTLMLSRIGVAGLVVAMMLALFLYMRHGRTLELHQQALLEVARIERERLESVVRQRTAELTDLARHLLTAREDERNRLARNLHDELGALLTAAKLDAARIRSRLTGSAPEALERLAHLVATLDSSIALGRRIIEDLRPSTLDNLGLAAALEILAREFSARSGVPVHCAVAPVRLSPSAELVVYRLVQEAVTNLSKYAQARNVWISLAASDGRVQASVRDDGVGFDPGAPHASTYGLLGMRYRAEAERGSLSIVSAPGQGTIIAVSLPESG